MTNKRELERNSKSIGEGSKGLDILENGPRSLSQAWLLQAMRYKYGQYNK